MNKTFKVKHFSFDTNSYIQFFKQLDINQYYMKFRNSSSFTILEDILTPTSKNIADIIGFNDNYKKCTLFHYNPPDRVNFIKNIETYEQEGEFYELNKDFYEEKKDINNEEKKQSILKIYNDFEQSNQSLDDNLATDYDIDNLLSYEIDFKQYDQPQSFLVFQGVPTKFLVDNKFMCNDPIGEHPQTIIVPEKHIINTQYYNIQESLEFLETLFIYRNSNKEESITKFNKRKYTSILCSIPLYQEKSKTNDT